MMRPQLLATAVIVSGCAGSYVAAPAQPTMPTMPTMPTRFAQVGPRLYRGGQPSETQLAALHALGVRTLITLRDTPDAVGEERAAAARLGMRLLSFPFSGLSDPDPALLRQVVAAMQETADGAIYVHCRQGRDRTSLVVALYRVWVERWAPTEAWQREATDFGHGGWRTFFFRRLDRAFVKLTS
jgi:protein tyrosine phosphatase (PTP) superfamily phosphohydrolase (DUF442 family)